MSRQIAAPRRGSHWRFQAWRCLSRRWTYLSAQASSAVSRPVTRREVIVMMEQVVDARTGVAVHRHPCCLLFVVCCFACLLR